jgi:hypothetical protein
VLSLAAIVTGLAIGVPPSRPDELHGAPSAPGPACDCAHFDAALANVSGIYASRNDDVVIPLTVVMHNRYRARVEEAYAQAKCLIDCVNVPERARNQARLLLCEAGFKDAGLRAEQSRTLLTAVLAAATRCLEVEPDQPACHIWHASSRGMLARGSWNPLNVLLPAQLIAEFELARYGAAPGYDHEHGVATRGQASLLLRVPRFAGGDPSTGRTLIERARSAPTFWCRVSNRVILAEAYGRTGDMERAREELRQILVDGLPACGPRYENAVSLEHTARCLARLTERPGSDDPGWNTDCQP